MKNHNKWICGVCNTRNSMKHSFCIRCGAQRPEQKYCKKCGAILTPDQRFCFDCGTPVESSIASDLSVQVTRDERITKDDQSLHSNTIRYCIKCSKPVNGEVFLCEQCVEKKRRTTSLWMRSVAAVLVVALLSGVAVHFVGSRIPKVKNAEQAISVLKDLGEEWGYENAFSELTEKNTTTVDGDTYYRLQQNYKGIPVYGKTVVYSANDKGKSLSVTGNLEDIQSEIDLTATVTEEQIAQSIQCDSDKLQGKLTEDNMCIYTTEDSKVYLAYIINIDAIEYILDARNGKIHFQRETVISAEKSAKGYTVSDKNRSDGFPVKEVGSYYIMSDEGRNLTVYTFDKNVSWSNREFLNERATVVESADIIFGNTKIEEQLEYEKGAKLFLYATQIYDYFEKLGFRSQLSKTNLYYNDGWDEGKNCLGGIDDGFGFVSMGYITGVECADLISHEFTHRVSFEIVKWKNTGENGAMNEALSDIFGEIIEAKTISKKADWVNEYRNIKTPLEKNNPEMYKGSNWGDVSSKKDNGYIHNNSTVISHAAYLMWNGIDGNATNKIDMDTLAKLWYRAMLMMPSDCNFVECRTLVELAASTMNLTDMQKQCVCEAFDAVGIPRASEEEYSQLVHLVTNGETAIKGTVHEIKTLDGVETVVPVPKATMTVYDEDSSKVYKKLNMKNKDGFFEIELPAGIYSVAISADGYIGQTITFKLDDNEVRYFSIAMKPAEEKTPTEVPTETLIKDNVLSGKCGDNLTWTLENGVLTISGTGAMYDYDPLGLSTDTSAMPAPWHDYAYNNEVTAIQIGDGVTYIGSYAFACCWNIDNIRIPGSVKEIGEHAFHACSNYPDKKLSVVIEEGVEVIGDGAFFECFTMMPITLPDSITYIGNSAFWNCRLTSITIPKNVTYIGSQVFYGVNSNTLRNIYFTGNAPQFADDAFLEEHLTAYYPGDNTTWTRSVMKDYGGHINWVKEHKPVILGSFKNLSEAYLYAINSKPNGRFSYGMLEDIDSDGTDELVLGYCDSINVDGTDWTAHCYSIYDYKNKNLICCVDNEVICYEVAGSSGRIGVVNYKNKPTLMLKKWKAPNGTTGDLFENYYTLLDANKYQPFRELRVDQHNDRNIWYEYYVDNSEVTQAGFEDELKNYKYLTLNSKGTVDYSYPEKSFDELKEYLESLAAPQTGMELAAYKPILEKVMKSSGYNTYNEYTRSYCEGILIDLDGDGVQELVLKHLSSNEPNFGTEYLLSVYDYENGKVITRLNGISFGEFGGAGESAAATILYKSGKPYIMTYNEFGETSPSGTMKPSITGIAKIYDGKTCKEIDSYWIDRYRNAMSYEIDGKSVAENVFINSIEAYDDVEVVCEMYRLIEFPLKLLTASKLLSQLK